MSKLSLPIILVVEGVTDQAFLSSFIECDYVITGGSAISRETIDYLVEASKTRQIVILTDPDTPGNQIRAKIMEAVPNASNAFVHKERAIKRHKVGVAETDKEEVLAALSNIVPGGIPRGTLAMNDLYELGLTGDQGSSERRDSIAAALNIGKCNAKVFLKRANALNISKQDLKDALNG